MADQPFADETISALRTVPRLRNEPVGRLRAIARLHAIASKPGCWHKTQPDHFAVPRQVLFTLFGEKSLNRVNTELRIFDELDCASRGQTKAYRMSTEISSAVDSARRANNIARIPVRMIDRNGAEMRKLPPALDAQSLKDTVWHAARVSNVSPIDIDALNRASAYLSAAYPPGGAQNAELLDALGAESGASVPYLHQIIDSLVAQSRNVLVRARGCVPVEYQAAATGRLFDIGAGLQGAPRVVKRIALNGLMMYDIANCHPSTIEQFATERLGLRCPIMREYLDNKTAWRTEIARDTGLSVLAIKRCLLAVMYGSRESYDSGRGDAISLEMGFDAARRFRQHPRVRNLTRELNRVSRHIDESLDRSDGGCFVNDAGFVYDSAARKVAGQKDTRSTRLAHVVQGWEVLILSTIVAHFGSKVVLLEHDGWTARGALGTLGSIESLIHRQTGWRVRIEVEQVTLPAAIRQ